MPLVVCDFVGVNDESLAVILGHDIQDKMCIRDSLSRALARLRGRDRDDNPLAEQQPATLRDANPVP